MVVLGLVAACGDAKNSARPDAADPVDAPDLLGDAFDGSLGPICDFVETADATNAMISTAEATSLTLASKLTLCGTVDTGHYESGSELVDSDGFSFTLAADTDILVHIEGANLDMADDTILQIRKNGVTQFFGFGVVVGDHGTLATRLPAGEYVALMGTFNGSALATAIDYRITIVTDMPDTRCPRLTTGGFAEAGDGGGNGNDVIDYDASANPSSSLSAAADTAEATGFTVEPAMQYRVTGSSAAVDPADDYEDRDTFQFTTGATTTQMTIRLNWASTAMDLDYRVYPVIASGDPLSIVGGLDESLAEQELETFAVKPSTAYWLWIAAADGATGQPSPYEATLCGEAYAP